MSGIHTVQYNVSRGQPNGGGPQVLSTGMHYANGYSGGGAYLRGHRQQPAAPRQPRFSQTSYEEEAGARMYQPVRETAVLPRPAAQDNFASSGRFDNGYRDPVSNQLSGGRPPGAPNNYRQGQLPSSQAPEPSAKHPRNGPLLKLTQGLLKTYKAINKRYYEAKKSKEKRNLARKAEQQNLQQRRTHQAPSAFERHPVPPTGPAQYPSSRTRDQPAEPGPAPSHHSAAPIDYFSPSKHKRQKPVHSAVYHQSKPEVKTHSHNPVQKASKVAKVQPAKKAQQVDTPDHDYIVRPGDILNDKYRLEKQIDKGCFGVVVLAQDMTSRDGKRVAIKIIKAKRAFFKQAQTEIDILSHLNYSDQDDSRRVVRLFEVFIHKNHRCLVFELLSHSLYKLLKDTNFKGVSLTLVRKFTTQLLVSLQFLRVKHPKGIIHADLKPENILLVSPERSQIKVIDFGSSCFEDRKMYSYIQSRFYRAPEVLLGKQYSYPIDMWSLGCILIELHTGEPVFPGLSEEDQLCKIIGILGMPPKSLLHHAKKKEKFFIQTNKGLQLKRPPPKKKSKDYQMRHSPILPLSELKRRTFEEAVQNARRRRQRETRDHAGRDYEMFLDLIRRMLVWEPDRRITPTEALSHPWLNMHKNAASRQPYYGAPTGKRQGLGSGRRQGAGQAGANYQVIGASNGAGVRRSYPANFTTR